jgi:hypothetical protein
MSPMTQRKKQKQKQKKKKERKQILELKNVPIDGT